MASICKVCGHSAGLFNLKNGICQACLNDSQTTADKAFESTKATTQTTPPEPQNNSLRFCSACGDKLAQISKFCPSCGGSVIQPATTPTTSTSNESIVEVSNVNTQSNPQKTRNVIINLTLLAWGLLNLVVYNTGTQAVLTGELMWSDGSQICNVKGSKICDFIFFAGASNKQFTKNKSETFDFLLRK